MLYLGKSSATSIIKVQKKSEESRLFSIQYEVTQKVSSPTHTITMAWQVFKIMDDKVSLASRSYSYNSIPVTYKSQKLRSQRDEPERSSTLSTKCAVDRVLDLYVADLGSIFNIPYDPWSLPGVIPEFISRSKAWTPLCGHFSWLLPKKSIVECILKPETLEDASQISKNIIKIKIRLLF